MTTTTLQQDYTVTNKRTLREATAQAVAQFLLAGGSITTATAKGRTLQQLSKHMGRTNKFGISR